MAARPMTGLCRPGSYRRAAHKSMRLLGTVILATSLQSCSVLEPEAVSDFPSLAVTVDQEPGFNALFKRCGPGWTGGDSTYSTPLSTNKVLWLFSDTFIGPVSPAGKRKPATEQFVQGNTLVLQDKTDNSFTTFLRKAVRGTAGTGAVSQSLPTYAEYPYDTVRCPDENFQSPHDARAMFQPPQCPSANHCYFWGGGMVADGGQLYTFVQLMEEKGAGVFDFAWRNSAIAVLPLDELATAEPVYISVPGNGVSYGGAVLADDDQYTYIYGMRAEPASNTVCSGHCLHVARVPKGELANIAAWQYWGATPGDPAAGDPAASAPAAGAPAQYGWRARPDETAPMAGNPGPAAAPMTQDQLGVARITQCGALPTCYVMIAHRYTGAASNDIVAWYAVHPQGPWAGPVFVYQTPEFAQPGQLFTYNSKIHPAFTNDEGLLVSYDVNSLALASDPLSALVTADNYRPRFIRVKLHWGAPSRANEEQRADTAPAGLPTSLP